MSDSSNSVRISLTGPKGGEAGKYANSAVVWHTEHDFTLDFALLGMTRTAEDGSTTIEAPIVSRVKVPVTVIFQIARAISENVDKYERTYGPITPRPDGDADGPGR